MRVHTHVSHVHTRRRGRTAHTDPWWWWGGRMRRAAAVATACCEQSCRVVDGSGVVSAWRKGASWVEPDGNTPVPTHVHTCCASSCFDLLLDSRQRR